MDWKWNIIWNSKPIRVRFEEKINSFCVEHYGKHCEKFSTYTDWEIYWIIWLVQIPYSTIVCFETYRDKDGNGALKVNSNWTLKYWRVTRDKFVAVWRREVW